LADETIEAAATGETGRLSDEHAAIVKWTDQLLANHTLIDAEREDALAQLTINQLSDLVLTVGFYQLVCNFLNTFDVTTDGEGEMREGPPPHCGTMQMPARWSATCC